jgi:hypothetical protein
VPPPPRGPPGRGWFVARRPDAHKHDPIDVVTRIGQRGVALRSLDESVDTALPAGKRTFHVFAALREFERDVLRERTRAALAATHPGCYDSTHRRSGAARWAEGEWVLDRLGSGRGQDEVGRSQDA